MASNRIRGITIEVGGDTTKLDKALAKTDSQLKKTTNNLKDVERLLNMDPGNVELLAQKQRLLQDAVDGTRERLRTLETAAEQAYQQLESGEITQQQFDALNRELIETRMNLEEATRAAEGFDIDEEVQRAQESLRDLSDVADNASDDLEDLTHAGDDFDIDDDVQQAEDSLRDLGDAADDASEDLENLNGSSGGLSGGLDGLKGIAVGAALVIGEKLVEAAMSAAEWLWSLDEATEEYREAMGKLNTAFEAAGYGIDAAQEAYQEFYKILGDTDTATEASQLLTQLVDNEEDIAKWTKIAAGVYGTFGDALPIEGLIEAANETAKTGKVTGVLADALNWVGMSEDEFNDALAKTSDEGKRAQLIMNNLGMAYEDAADSFYKNNEVLIETRENQAKLDDAQAELGESVADLKNKLLELFGPALIVSMQAVTGLFMGLSVVIETIGKAVDWLGEKIQGVIGFFEELFGASKQASNISVGGNGKARSLDAPYSLRMATSETLPYLAQGTVTRPNSPFLAVVGDNPNEPEIVSPLSTIERAVRNVMDSGGGQASNIRVNINFTGSGAQLVRMLQPLITVETERRGPQLAT